MKLFWLSCLLGASLAAQIQMSDVQIQKMGIKVQEVRLIRSEAMGPMIGMIDYSDKGAKSYTLGAEASVVELLRHKGDLVKKGEVICKIASSELLSSLAERNDLRNRLKLAQEYAHKDQQLYQDGVLSLREAQKSALEENTLRTKIQEIEGRFAFAGADIKASDGMSFTIRAKQSGVLAEAPLKTGEKIEPFRPYLKIASTKEFTAYIKIPPKLIGSISKGASVLDTQGHQIGTVMSTTGSVDVLNNTATVVAALKNSDQTYRPGTSSEFYIAAPISEKWVLLPRSSVSKYKKKDICFVKTATGFEPKTVEIKKIYKEHIAVSAEGFTSHTKVAKDGIITLKGALSGMGFE
ncbi:MAG: efflux RND transporter periplasmic adaptor subunit [Campylobacterales bacterium]|nr:efflux RND transporter periplasmic adaptor subunit [Campylobacterales bacterium]